MTREQIIDKLRDILAATNGQGQSAAMNVTEDTNLFSDLGLTSVSMLYMVIAIEEDFGIRFENVGASDFTTLGEVVDYIEARV